MFHQEKKKKKKYITVMTLSIKMLIVSRILKLRTLFSCATY